MGDHLDVRVELLDRLLGGVDLAHADPVDVVQDLALQVGAVDDVHIDDAERADTRRRQVQARRAAEAAGAEQQHLGIEQLHLTFLAHLGQQQMALVAVLLVGIEALGHLPLAALVLPLAEPARHRRHVGVTQFPKRLGREDRTHAACALHDQRRVLVGQAHLDLALEVATGDEQRPGYCTRLVLVGLAHVEDHRALVAQPVGGLGIDLTNLLLGRLEEVTEVGHRSRSLLGVGALPGKVSGLA